MIPFSFLKGILSFIEDKTLGFLMEETESEKNILLSKAKKLCSSFRLGLKKEKDTVIFMRVLI